MVHGVAKSRTYGQAVSAVWQREPDRKAQGMVEEQLSRKPSPRYLILRLNAAPQPEQARGISLCLSFDKRRREEPNALFQTHPGEIFFSNTASCLSL